MAPIGVACVCRYFGECGGGALQFGRVYQRSRLAVVVSVVGGKVVCELFGVGHRVGVSFLSGQGGLVLRRLAGDFDGGLRVDGLKQFLLRDAQERAGPE